ncbi:hypothetical protein DENSPDRAFT_834445 [Dentipellis sp. KUC8613]|nr:hypothetical protein DENSPDRAFT_834445 [Dentipellis sp. KUC8613]
MISAGEVPVHPHPGQNPLRVSSSSGVDMARANTTIRTRRGTESQLHRSVQIASNNHGSHQPSDIYAGAKHYISPEQAISSSIVPNAPFKPPSSTTPNPFQDGRFSELEFEPKPRSNAAAEYQIDLRSKKRSKLRGLNALLPRHLRSDYDPPRLIPVLNGAIEHIEQLHEENQQLRKANSKSANS